MQSSRPTTGDILELVKGLRDLGAVQVVWGDFSCTLEPPSPFAAETVRVPSQRLDAIDDVFADEDAGEAALKEAKRQAEQKRKAVEHELFGATEMGD
jgi:hypothetical protein